MDYQFKTDADGLTMNNVSFRATVPKGTSLIAGTIYPGSGVYHPGTPGSVIWLSPGAQTEFDSGFSVKAASRPGTKNAICNFSGATRVEGYPRSASGSSKIPVETFSQGQIDYYNSANVKDGLVSVDEPCSYTVSGWDWYGGDVAVSLNGASIGTATEAVPSGTFTAPVFKDADLESVLTAQQTGKPVDTIITGKEASVVEFVSGSVAMVNGDGTIARKLARGGKVANGEVVTSDTASPDQLGHLLLNTKESAVVLHYLPATGYGSDGRLLFARGGDVSVFGGIRPSAIRVVNGASLSYTKQNLTGYDTSNMAGVQNLGSSQTGATTLTGPVYSGVDLAIKGDVTLSGAICYFAGNVTITGTVSGTGSIVCIGKLTVGSGAKLKVQQPTGFALGVGGTLIIDP